MSYLIPITHHISELTIDKGIFIFLHRANKVPPHLGLIVTGKLFEISINGPGYDFSGSLMLKTAQKRKVEVILIELKMPNQQDREILQLITNLVKHYEKVTNEVSCLSPIKDFIQQVYKLEVNSVNFIFELLPVLFLNNLVKSTAEINLTDKLIENKFLLKQYTKQDIEDCITAVNRKNNIEISVG